MSPRTIFSKQELLSRLTFEQFRVTQFGRTERPFSDEVHKFSSEGVYHCIVCDEALFSSDHKFNSGTGWPSFWAPIDCDRIIGLPDPKGASGVENSCGECGAHLGHLFDDLKTPTRQRYCINSASLRFHPATDD